MQRRQFIKLIAASSLASACTADADSEATVAQQEGPYYPVVPIGNSNNLLLGSGHSGSELRLSGTVSDTNGNLLTAARVEIWQCDGKGVYLHPKAPNHQTFDSNFRGFGATVTDNKGHYEFATIVPVPYTGRPPHIHTKVFINDKEKLTSQIYLKDSGGHKHLKMELLENADTSYISTFDFVIKT